MRRLVLIAVSGVLMIALAATVAVAQSNTATLSFEVTEGEFSPDALYLGGYHTPDTELFNTVELADPDGDGTHTGSVELQTGEYVVRIDQAVRGGTVNTIRGPETINLDEDTTISARTGFDGPQPRCFLPEGCFISGDGSSETLAGGIGPDYIIGGGGDDALYGLGAGDWLDGGAGDDLVRGGDSDDLVDGGTGNDLVRGDDGNDYVSGFTGNDALYGGVGSDFIYAADGEFDRVSGGRGYDVCVVDEGDDVSGCEEVYTQ